MKAAKIILIVVICLVSLGALYLGFVFTIGSGFIFAGDIDLTDEQRNAAGTWVGIGTAFGLVLMIGSVHAIIFSNAIAKRILKIFGAKFDK